MRSLIERMRIDSPAARRAREWARERAANERNGAKRKKSCVTNNTAVTNCMHVHTPFNSVVRVCIVNERQTMRGDWEAQNGIEQNVAWIQVIKLYFHRLEESERAQCLWVSANRSSNWIIIFFFLGRFCSCMPHLHSYNNTVYCINCVAIAWIYIHD